MNAHYTNTNNPVDSEKWWSGSNKAFCGDTPEQIYSVAPSAVYAYLMKSAEGEW